MTWGNVLSVREIEILSLLQSGAAPKEIAKQIGLSSNTVRNHVKSIYRKIGVHTRGELLAKAIRNNSTLFPIVSAREERVKAVMQKMANMLREAGWTVTAPPEMPGVCPDCGIRKEVVKHERCKQEQNNG